MSAIPYNPTASNRKSRLLMALGGLGAVLALTLLVLMGQSVAAILAVIVIGAGIAVLAWPEAATLIYVFALYSNALVIASQFHGVPSFIASAVTGLLLIPLASALLFHRQPLVSTPALPLMGLYLLVMLLSAVFTNNAAEAFEWIVTFMTEGLLLYFLLTNVLRDVSTVQRVTVTLLIVGSFVGGLSIYQELTKSYNNNFGGFAQVREGVFTVGEDLFGKVTQRRLSGPIGEQNRYAQMMLVLVPLAFFQFIGAKTLLGKLLSLAAAGLIIGGMLLTFSRGAMVSLALIVMIMTFWKYIKLYQAILLGLLMFGLVLVVAPTWLTRFDSFRGIEGVVNEESGEKADGAIRGRTTSNIAAWYVFLDHPILGVGPGQYYEQYSQKIANQLGIRFFVENRRAHNLYLETAADTGILGLGVMMAIFLVTLQRLYRWRLFWLERRPDLANLATAYLLGIVGYMSTAIFLHLSYLRYFALQMAVANAVIFLLQREAQRRAAALQPAEPASPSVGQGRNLHVG